MVENGPVFTFSSVLDDLYGRTTRPARVPSLSVAAATVGAAPGATRRADFPRRLLC